MKVGVELLARRIELDDAVLLQGLEELGLGHVDTIREGLKLRVGVGDRVGDVLKGEGEDVDGGEKVRGEALDGELVGFGGLLS